MAAGVTARKTTAGAQKWVIQRVKKRRGVVTARSVGLWVRDQVSRKSRVWSRAMMTMTRPRAISMEAIRFIWRKVRLREGGDQGFFDGCAGFSTIGRVGS